MLFEFCKEHAFSQNTYETRTAVVLMMRYLLTDEFGEDVISSGNVDAATQNRAIQKIRDSYRVSDSDKAFVNSLKR